MTTLHCTTCDAVIPAGAPKCPGCGLQLTTTAAPAVYIEKARWPFWPVILGALFIVFLLMHELDRQDATAAASSAEVFAADFAAGKISTVEEFAGRCGRPRIIGQASELHYNSGGAGDYLVTLSGTPHIELEHVNEAHVARTDVAPTEFYRHAGCK